MSNLRPFEDLIKPIEHKGETFIPAVRIACLAFNFSESAVLSDGYKTWVNNVYDYRVFHRFCHTVNVVNQITFEYMLAIDRNYSICTYSKVVDKKDKNPAYNQVKIFKLLIEWGFISLDE